MKIYCLLFQSEKNVQTYQSDMRSTAQHVSTTIKGPHNIYELHWIDVSVKGSSKSIFPIFTLREKPLVRCKVYVLGIRTTVSIEESNAFYTGCKKEMQVLHELI